MDLDTFLDPLIVNQGRLADLAIKFCRTYKSLALTSLDQFLATPVNVLPSGSERGKFVAIDFGGTNLRVGLVELAGAFGAGKESIRLINEKSWPIGDQLKMDHAEDLFLWVGDCIASVVRECLDLLHPQYSIESPDIKVVPMGITFSFPMIQNSIREATLMTMGKGFAITSNLNLGKLVLEGYRRHMDEQLPALEITAITNDTVATFASLAYVTQAQSNDRVAMGLIVGTGVNATTSLKLRDLHWSKRAPLKLPTSVDSDEATTIVNTEWTIKGAAPPLRDLKIITRWDEELDKSTEVPGFQPFEYMVAGRYLGELVRLITYDYFLNQLKLQKFPAELTQRNGISTMFLSTTVVSCSSTEELKSRLNQHMPWQWTDETALTLQKVAQQVQKRSASLVAAASVGLLMCADELRPKGTESPVQTNGFNPNFWRQDKGDLIIAYTGGTIARFPGYLTCCQADIDYLVNEITTARQKVVLKEAADGGILGAGVLAGTVWHLPRRGSDTFSVPPNIASTVLNSI